MTTWEEWGTHVLEELKRLSAAQKEHNKLLSEFLVFRAETKTATKVTAILISAAFGLVSLGVTIFVAYAKG